MMLRYTCIAYLVNFKIIICLGSAKGQCVPGPPVSGSLILFVGIYWDLLNEESASRKVRTTQRQKIRKQALVCSINNKAVLDSAAVHFLVL